MQNSYTLTQCAPHVVDMAHFQMQSNQRVIMVPSKHIKAVAQPVRALPLIKPQKAGLAPKQRARLMLLKHILKTQIQQEEPQCQHHHSPIFMGSTQCQQHANTLECHTKPQFESLSITSQVHSFPVTMHQEKQLESSFSET